MHDSILRAIVTLVDHYARGCYFVLFFILSAYKTWKHNRSIRKKNRDKDKKK